MSLMRKKYTELPEDAIVMNEPEAFAYQMKILTKWKDPWDIFGFKYGAVFLSVSSALTGIYVNNYYRNKLMLFNWGKVSTYLPICIIPSVTAFFLHKGAIIPDLVLSKSRCPVCTEMRASAIQVFVGAILPMLLGPVSSFSIAHKYGTYDIPYLHKEPKKVFQVYMKLTKPIANILFAIFVGQALLASVVTYAEAKSINTVNMKLRQLEYDLEHGIKAD